MVTNATHHYHPHGYMTTKRHHTVYGTPHLSFTAQVLREMIGLSNEEFAAKMALGERAIEMEFEAHGSEVIV